MDLIIDLTGDVTDRQELLNGTESVTIEGVSDDARWTVVAGISWNMGMVSYDGEGDLALSRSDGAEIFGSVSRSDVSGNGSAEDADYVMRIQYEIDGGSGEFEGASGGGRAELTVSGLAFRGRWELSLAAPVSFD